MIDLAWLIPALPLAGFLTILLFGRKLGDPKAGYLATAAVGGSFLVTALVYLDLLGNDAEERNHIITLFHWVPVGDLQIDLAFKVDQLSITMLLFVTGIGALIHLYATGYMHGDPKFSKFFLYLNLFVLSMTLLVLGENLLVTFLGWEGVGTCSYLLISFWHNDVANASAGKKAFVTNRVGDLGVLIAMFFMFQYIGSLSYDSINHAAEAGSFPRTAATAMVAMLFVGACGKSAQLPLYVWLPDAMAGPTPVSALIHAATMVTSGVFLLTRLAPLLHYAEPWMMTVIAIVGVATALFAATIAVAQNDIKKVLAYSTVSQLGYMFLAIGSGAYVAAIFHMITHAFFKALLFLGAGSVINGMHHEQDMRKMGALRAAMPITFITFIIGWLAIAGVPPFAGFWSKDEILLFAYDKSPILWFLGLVAALLTAFYMTRQVIMVWFGKARWNDPVNAAEHHALAAADGEDAAADGTGHDHADGTGHAHDAAHDDGHGHAVEPHESPATMTMPLVVLAVLAALGGLLNLPFSAIKEQLLHWLEPIVHHAERELSHGSEDIKWVLAGVATAVALAGIALAWLVYQKHKIKAVEPEILANGWYYDASISKFMGGPGRDAFDGVAWFDANVVDGAVNGTGKTVQGLAGVLRKAQNGLVRTYAAMIGVGIVALLVWFLIRGVVQ